MRAHENPALDTALAAARRFELPVFAFQELGESEPYACDRFHTFALEGARDLAAEMARRGVGYALHVERRRSPGVHIDALARRAALVVTEESAAYPRRWQVEDLAAGGAAPLWCVEAACVVPPRLVGKPYERAFEYRAATEELYRDRLTAAWSDEPAAGEAWLPGNLPFEPVALEGRSIPELVAECDIDHSIGPVIGTPGGSKAGYARWRSFRDNLLRRYAEARNDALAEGVSRMSAYLNYGMVSPLRIAREAAMKGARGAEKFLDELLIWRELAHCFCHYRADHGQLAALPEWARGTLGEHEDDPRERVLDWETLARGRTGDGLWDAAQRSLLAAGELHNNVRMTWGKAVAGWTRNPAEALATLIDLNHRYALDGRSAASYGGILWCLGQFDRPFSPERPVVGTVRERTTAQHAARLDPAAYAAKVNRASRGLPPVAVIGAGISGLACARILADHGFTVRVFDKGRGVGGRMSTRRAPGGRQFDHGAQYFTARDERFRRYVMAWRERGVVAEWEGRIATVAPGRLIEPPERKNETQRFVGVPGMSAVCRHLASDINVETGVRVTGLESAAEGWRLAAEDGRDRGRWDAVVVAIPAQQAAVLLAGHSHLSQTAGTAVAAPCWVVMVQYEEPLNTGFDAAFVHDSPLSWVARNSSKPGRVGEGDSWVLHAGPEWSREYLEETPEIAAGRLMAAFAELVGPRGAEPAYVNAHRWRYALPEDPLADRCLWDGRIFAGACGDWCGGPRVEGAFLSGAAMAGRLMAEAIASRRRHFDADPAEATSKEA